MDIEKKQKKIENPLVSIIVITYNNAKSLLKTLESAKTQTYQNIELIVSDDCSTDETVEICRNWIEENKERFVRTEMVMIKKNTGVTANCNRGVESSQGEWIKLIAGDDTLKPKAISEFVRFSLKHNVQVCISKLELFSINGEVDKSIIAAYEFYYNTLKKPFKQQQQIILKMYYVPGPGLFYSRKLYEKVGGYDEDYPASEEWPFVLRVIQAGNQIHLIEMDLVKYQISMSSLSRQSGRLSYDTFKSNMDYFFKVRRKLLFKHWMFLSAIDQTRMHFAIQASYPNKSRNRLKILFWSLISPKFYYRLLQNLFNNKD